MSTLSSILAEFRELATIKVISDQVSAILASQVRLEAMLSSIVTQQEHQMAIEQDLVSAIADIKDETTQVVQGFLALEAEIAALHATAGTPGVDPAVVLQAITDLRASAATLKANMPVVATIPPVVVPPAGGATGATGGATGATGDTGGATGATSTTVGL